jgi:uncharacterized protein
MVSRPNETNKAKNPANMESTYPSAKPLEFENRISLLDSLRGMALLGILLMNIPFFANSYHLYYNLEILKEYSGPDYWCWWGVNGLFEGTMRGIFSMLFGAGSFLLLDRLEKKNIPGLSPADIFYRRLIWLLVFGLINAFVLLWPGDILYTYAITGLFLFPFRKLKPASLLLFGLLFMAFSTAQHTFKSHSAHVVREKGEKALALEKKGKKLEKAQKEDLEAWTAWQEEHSISHFRAEMVGENGYRKKGYADIFEKILGINVYIETKDFYNELFFDALSFFLIGMALFKWGFLTGSLSTGWYLCIVFIAYLIGLPLSYYQHHMAIMQQFDYSRFWEAFPVAPYQIRRILLALGHISLFILFFRWKVFPFVFNWLAKVGQMAFSNYLIQTIICNFLFNGYGFGLFGELHRYQLYQISGLIWIFQILFSNIWLRFFLFGPFEWLWRSLTYWELQPIVKIQSRDS